MQPGSGSLNNKVSLEEYVTDALKRILNISDCNEALLFCLALRADFQQFNREFFTNEKLIRDHHDWYSLACISFAIAWSAHPTNFDACLISNILHEMCYNWRNYQLRKGSLFSENKRRESVITEEFKTYLQASEVPSRNR